MTKNDNVHLNNKFNSDLTIEISWWRICEEQAIEGNFEGNRMKAPCW